MNSCALGKERQKVSRELSETLRRPAHLLAAGLPTLPRSPPPRLPIFCF